MRWGWGQDWKWGEGCRCSGDDNGIENGDMIADGFEDRGRFEDGDGVGYGARLQPGSMPCLELQGPWGQQVLTQWHQCPVRAGAMCSPVSHQGTEAYTGAHTPCTATAAPLRPPAETWGQPESQDTEPTPGQGW